ncbi:YesL family protein [Tepidibacillus infernus]|uniref:YesL family protein n=1 Tax=Tepidibacillus infernus TaxID=1806172 RepID=UPI003B754187
MNALNNRLFHTLNTIVDLFLLNLLWVFASIPLITFFPATAAMFGVVRRRILQKETEGIFKSFFKMLKENFKQSFVLSIFWSVLAIFLYFDYRHINPASSVVQLILYIILIIGILLFSSISIYLFPIMVHFELSWKLVIRNAFFFSLMNPVLTVLLLIIVGAGVTLLYIYPVSILIIGSLVASTVYYLCQIWFNQLLNMKEMN